MADQMPTNEELFQQAQAPEPQPPAEPEPAPQPEPEPAPQPQPEAAEAGIPSWRLREEAEARRAAETRAGQLEERLRQIDAHMRQQAAQTKPKDFFEDPEAEVERRIRQVIEPVLEAQRIREQERHRVDMYNSEMLAKQVHGEDVVAKAEEAFMQAIQDKSLDTMEYERVVQSPNRYDAAVRWYTQRNVISSVGNDPDAWFQKRLEASMADPQFQAQMLERIRAGAASRPGTTQLPPSLSKVTAAKGNGPEPVGDLSDKSLFEFATRP